MEEPYREAGLPATLSPNKKYCHACAAVLDTRAELCPRCGVRQPMAPTAQELMAQQMAMVPRSTRSKATAGIFALLLGGLGVHKFYLGQTGQGILYLLFCWTFIPAIVSFIEGILLLSMSEDTFARRFP